MKNINYCLVILLVCFTILTSCATIPKVKAPKKNISIDRIDPTFKWDFAKKDNLTFEMKIAEDSNFSKNILHLKTNKTYLHLDIPYLERGKKYFWVVRAIYYDESEGKYLKTDWSYENRKKNIPYTFYVDDFASGYTGFRPRIIQPDYNEKIMSLKPEIEWEFPDHSEILYKVKNVNAEWVYPGYEEISYEIQIARNKTFTSDLKKFETKDNKKSFKITIPYLKKGEDYFLKVRAKYFDPYTHNYKNSKWSIYSPEKRQLSERFKSDLKEPYKFIVSKNAIGNFGLETGQEEEILTSEVTVTITQLTTNEKDDWSPTVSTDGKKLAFCSNRNSGDEGTMVEIYYLDLSGRVGTGERRKTFSNPGNRNLNPFWLTDNENVGFYSNRLRENPNHFNLFLSNKGKGVTYVNDGMKYIGDGMGYLKKGSLLTGSCSTEDKIIYTVKSKFDKQYYLWLYDINNHSFTQLNSGLFPDIKNNKIVYSIPISKTNWNIWIMDLEGNSIFNETQLTSELGVKDYDPSWSPDGSRIAFASDRKANADIWIMNADGTNATQLTYNPMPDRNPQWIDNETIVFQTKRGKDKDGNPQWDIYKLLSVPEIRD